MSSTSEYSTHTGSRLIALLCELLGADGEIPHQHFITKLSKLIDFSGAIELSASLATPVKYQGVAKVGQSTGVRDVFMGARKDMLAFIAQSFVVDNRHDQPFYLPLVSDKQFSHEDNGLSSYQNFYSLHQSEMEVRVARLRKSIRKHLSSHSPKLARLADMDATFSAIVGEYSRKAFTSIPQLLAQRFQKLSALHVNTEQVAVTTQFVVEMRSVLLAELDIRLKPVLGLVESLLSADQAAKEEKTLP